MAFISTVKEDEKAGVLKIKHSEENVCLGVVALLVIQWLCHRQARLWLCLTLEPKDGEATPYPDPIGTWTSNTCS